MTVMTGEQERPSMSGAGLLNNYIFSQALFHWGDLTGGGSEHTRSRVPFAMEIQFLHYKETAGSLSAALESGDWDSLAVLSVFSYVPRQSRWTRPYLGYFQLQNRIQDLAPHMDFISGALENITEPGMETEV